MKKGLLYTQCITPLHNGTGQSLGSVDRPILRESFTRFPYFQSSGLKGAIRARANDELKNNPSSLDVVEAAFGKGATDGNQGCILSTDLRVLLLPVRSLAGVFALVTCPLVLARFQRLCTLVKGPELPVGKAITNFLEKCHAIDGGNALGPALIEKDEKLRFNDHAIRLSANGPYVLEDRVLQPRPEEELRDLAAKFNAALVEALFDGSFWRDFYRGRIVIVSDDDFRDFCERAVPVEANIAMEETGVTVDGSLRYTEYLPEETVLTSMITIDRPLKSGHQQLTNEVEALLRQCLKGPSGDVPILQLGADESKGKGIVRPILDL